MARLIWTDTALDDIQEIAEYIALDNPEAARNLVRDIFRTAERLEQHPESGRKPPELKKTVYRELVVGPCRIFYRRDNEKIYILYVMRGERMLRKYLLEERRKNRYENK
jgi:toxin ParE1/3/4